MATDTVPAAVPGPPDRPDQTATGDQPAKGLIASMVAAVEPARSTFDLTPTTGSSDTTADPDGALDRSAPGVSSASFRDADEAAAKDPAGEKRKAQGSVWKAWWLAAATRWAKGGGATNKRLDLAKAKAQAHQVKENRTTTAMKSGGLPVRNTGGSGAGGSKGSGKSGGNSSGKGPSKSNGSGSSGAGRGGSGAGSGGGRGAGGGSGSNGSGSGSRKPKDTGSSGKSGAGPHGAGGSGKGKDSAGSRTNGSDGGSGKGSSGRGSGGKTPNTSHTTDGKNGSALAPAKDSGSKNGKQKNGPSGAGGAGKGATGASGSAGRNGTSGSGGNAGTSGGSGSGSGVDLKKGNGKGKGSKTGKGGQQQAGTDKSPLQKSRETGHGDGTKARRVVDHVKAYADGTRDGWDDEKNKNAKEHARLDKAHDTHKTKAGRPEAAIVTEKEDDGVTTDVKPLTVKNIDANTLTLGTDGARSTVGRRELRNFKQYERKLEAKETVLQKIAEACVQLEKEAENEARECQELAEQAKGVKGGDKLVGQLNKLAEAAKNQAAEAAELAKRARRAAEMCKVVLTNIQTRYAPLYKAVQDSDETKPAELRFYNDKGSYAPAA